MLDYLVDPQAMVNKFLEVRIRKSALGRAAPNAQVSQLQVLTVASSDLKRDIINDLPLLADNSEHSVSMAALLCAAGTVYGQTSLPEPFLAEKAHCRDVETYDGRVG